MKIDMISETIQGLVVALLGLEARTHSARQQNLPEYTNGVYVHPEVHNLPWSPLDIWK